MRRWLRRLALAGAALLLLTAVAVVIATAAMQQRHGEGRSLAQPVDAAIILGAGVEPDGVLHYSSRRRVAAGVALLRAGQTDRLILSGGMVPYVGTSAAALMRDYAISLGAAPGSVLVEDQSRTTFENLRFSFRLAHAAGLRRLALVTDDSHLLRASWLACYFGDCGIALVAVPTLGSSIWSSIRVDTVLGTGRETLAWWYNLGKIASWSILDSLGIPESRREQLVR